MRIRYDVDFGSLPMPGGFVVTLDVPEDLDEVDARVVGALPPSGGYTSKALVYDLLQSVSVAAGGSRRSRVEDGQALQCLSCGKVRHGHEEVCPLCGSLDANVVEEQDVADRDWAV